MSEEQLRRFLLTAKRRLQNATFAEFVEQLVQHNPQRFGRIIPHQLSAASLMIYHDLELTEEDLEGLLTHLQCEYGVVVCEIHRVRISQPRDISLYDLYKLLLHSERMQERTHLY